MTAKVELQNNIREQTGKTLIRLFLHNQSDLSLHCVSRPFRQANSVQNLRTATVTHINLMSI